MWRLAALALLCGAWASPALAAPADPDRSRAEAQAPILAPGTWGSAPLTGDMAPSGAFVLYANAASLSTGNAVYDGLLRQVLSGTLVMRSDSAKLVFAGGITRRYHATARISAGKAAASVPVILRIIKGPTGSTMRTYFSVPLAPYGVRTATGGLPGSVRVAVTAFFPGL